MDENIFKEKEKRLPHLDLLRLGAIYLVIFNHTGNLGYTLFAENLESPLSFLYMAFSIFCKIAVPLFFMISGALLLKKDESLKDLFMKRIVRIVIVLLLISVPYYYWLHKENGLQVIDFLSFIYGNSASTSLWYLYSYIALLLMMPFLRSMVKNMREKDFLYLAIGYIVFSGILPCVEYLLWGDKNVLHESFSVVLFTSQNVFFALMGYCLEHVCSGIADKKIIRLSVSLSIVSILVTCGLTYYQMSFNADQPEKFFNYFISVPTLTVFYLVKSAGNRIHNENVRKRISLFGTAVFGVYLIEKFLRAISAGIYTILFPVVGSFIASLLWSFVVFSLGIVCVVVLKKIPVIKKVINKFI